MGKTINDKQIKFDEKPIPKVNQTCMFFDDGKISYSRMYQATVKQVMVYDDAPDKVKKAFERESKAHDWIWNKTTDYIIACARLAIDNAHNLFPPTLRGVWFQPCKVRGVGIVTAIILGTMDILPSSLVPHLQEDTLQRIYLVAIQTAVHVMP